MFILAEKNMKAMDLFDTSYVNKVFLIKNHQNPMVTKSTHIKLIDFRLFLTPLILCLFFSSTVQFPPSVYLRMFNAPRNALCYLPFLSIQHFLLFPSTPHTDSDDSITGISGILFYSEEFYQVCICSAGLLHLPHGSISDLFIYLILYKHLNWRCLFIQTSAFFTGRLSIQYITSGLWRLALPSQDIRITPQFDATMIYKF